MFFCCSNHHQAPSTASCLRWDQSLWIGHNQIFLASPRLARISNQWFGNNQTLFMHHDDQPLYLLPQVDHKQIFMAHHRLPVSTVTSVAQIHINLLQPDVATEPLPTLIIVAPMCSNQQGWPGHNHRLMP